MSKNIYKNCIRIILIIVIILQQTSTLFSKPVKTENEKLESLVTLKILEDLGNLDKPVERAEFAKIIVRSSKFRENTPEYINEDVCNDVSSKTPYAPYIKKVLDEGYMFTYLGGIFKPKEYVTYSDLTRACLALLSYSNDDFRGNQVIGRNLKFESLGLDENVNKNEVLNKKDIANGIYNTLKEKIKDSNSIYGTSIFKDLIVDSDNEINASEYIKKDIKGPNFAKSIDQVDTRFELNDNNIYINGVKSKKSDLTYDIEAYGYAIYYIDNTNNILYAYTERQDIAAPVMLRKGYVYKIYYSASNFFIPYRVDIDNYKYYLDSEEVKFAFSANGRFKEDDYIVYIYNKMNDITSAYIGIREVEVKDNTDDTSEDDTGEDETIEENNNKTTTTYTQGIIHKDDDVEKYNGSIIMAYDISLIK